MNTGEAISLPLAVSVYFEDGGNLLPTVDGAMIVSKQLPARSFWITGEVPPSHTRDAAARGFSFIIERQLQLAELGKSMDRTRCISIDQLHTRKKAFEVALNLAIFE